MQGDPRRDRDWEHWPDRTRADDGIRHRLKGLFSATDDEEAVEALISERGREIEAQTARLHATIEGLERREEQAARLRVAVEEMLRHGSAELDERQAELAALADDLRAREERVRELEEDIATRKQELGAVELLRAAVERRERAATDRERALERAAAELRDRGVTVFPGAGEPEAAHFLFVSDDGYRFAEREGPAPVVGETVKVEGRTFVVNRVGRSPLPGDRRRCAYVEALAPSSL